MSCPDCAAGPKGFDGHDHLLVVDDGSHPAGTFRCSQCGDAYAREYQGSGVFVWLRTAGRQDPAD
jgi:hypothetical protein